MRQLNNRIAVVTGAASGIGQATSILLAQQGARMALVDINAQGLRQTRTTIEKNGGVATTHTIDVADKEQMQQLPTEVARSHGAVHILVNNAGVGMAGTFEEMALEDFEWLMAINFWSVVFGSRYFLPYLRKEDEAHIVNVSSLAAMLALPSMTAYSASKFAVRGFTESLKLELKDTHIGVTCVHPSAVRTGIIDTARFGKAYSGVSREDVLNALNRGVSAARAAKLIVRAIRKRKERLMIGRDAIAADAFARLFPTTYGRRLLLLKDLYLRKST